MADNSDELSRQQPERIRYLPEWETPSHPPKRSLFSRLTSSPASRWNSHRQSTSISAPPLATASALPSSHVTTIEPAAQKDEFALGERSDTDDRTLSSSFAPLPPEAPNNHSPYLPQPATRSNRLSSRFDALLPPYRRYFGDRLSRRSLMLFVVLPIALLLILALALGLGLGLRNRGSGGSNSTSDPAPGDLPLPNKGTDKIYTGDITYYGTGLGACGITSSDSDMITAVAHSVFDATMPAGVTNPNANPLCGKRIRVTRDYSEAGKGLVTVDVVVVDRCVGCQPTDLDLAPAVFLRLAPESKGRVLASWHWLD